jgi:hypothetical protein
MRTKKSLLVGLILAGLIACGGVSTFGQTIGAAQAKEQVGKTTTVCGKVASAHYAASSRGKPTFINLDEPYPNQIFTIVIWGSDRPKFGEPEVRYQGKRICVTGQIKEYRGVPEIVAYDSAQIKAQADKNK